MRVCIGMRYAAISEDLRTATIAPAFEVFGATPILTPTLQIQAMLTPPMSRHWFETEDGEHLVQLQQDRILHNWRQRSPEMKYPRYERVRDARRRDCSNIFCARE